MNSILEITDTAYCLKLSKDTFDLTFIRRLLKKIETDHSFARDFNEDDIISRSQRDAYEAYFDTLEDK